MAVAVVTAMTMLTGTASAALSKGFSTKAACETARKAYPTSDPCFYWSSKQAWYFKY